MSEKENNEILEKESLDSDVAGETENRNAEFENTVEEKKEETCEEKVVRLELEIQEWKNSYTRKLAEFQNFTKRKENEPIIL